jgi:hypothetical protein
MFFTCSVSWWWVAIEEQRAVPAGVALLEWRNLRTGRWSVGEPPMRPLWSLCEDAKTPILGAKNAYAPGSVKTPGADFLALILLGYWP